MKNNLILLFFLLTFTLYSQNSNQGTEDKKTIDESTLTINNDSTNTPPALNSDGGVPIRTYLVGIFVFIIVIAALYFVLKIIKKVGGNRIGLDNDLIHVISTKALKGTTALHLVEVGKQIFLIGATDNSINSIAEITEQESKDMIALNLSTDDVSQNTFFNFLADKLKKNNLNDIEKEETPKINTQKDKLDRF